MKKSHIFISYSHNDQEYLDRILVHLKRIEKVGIDTWSDLRLRPGDQWREEIALAIERASVAILLVSADFLAPDFITENELPPLLSKAAEQGARIIPVIVKACGFERDKNLNQFHALNKPTETVARMTEGKREKLYDKLSAEVERIFQEADLSPTVKADV